MYACFFQGKTDVGRIIVYKNSGPSNDFSYQVKKEISPNELESRSRFGSSIAKIGDIHKDGLEDFAVGAPGFDEGKGAVIIFHGCTDFNFEHYQRIRAEDFNFPAKSGFGYSLSKELSDIDSNGYNDLAIGAPFNGSAVILRSRPLVSFQPSKIEFDPYPHINPEEERFTLKLRIETKNWTHNTQNVYADVEVQYDERIEWLDSDSSKIRFKITNNEPLSHIQNLTFKAKDPKFGIDPDDPIEPKAIKVEAKIKFQVDECQTESKIGCPIISPNVALQCASNCNPKAKIDLNNCKDMGSCNCALDFNLLPIGRKEIVVGVNNTIKLEFDVQNQGLEPSYGATMVFNSTLDFSSVKGQRGVCTKLSSVEVS